MEIRIVSPEDAAEIVRTANRIDRTSLQTAQTIRALLERGTPEGTERLVAEVDGAIVGWAPSGLHADDSGWLWIGVDAAHRHRGIARSSTTASSRGSADGYSERRPTTRRDARSSNIVGSCGPTCSAC